MLTDFQKQKLPKLFSVHDLNRDGRIDRSDFEEYAKRIASSRGWGPGSTEASDLRGRFLAFWGGLGEVGAQHGRSSVTMDDWLEYWDEILGTPGMYDRLATPIARMVFTILDRDGDGSVTADEYAAIYDAAGADRRQASSAFARMDGDQDGRLSVDEIMTLLDQFFRSEDPEAPGNALFGLVEARAVN